MKKRSKQPLESVRPWVPWTLVGLGVAEIGLSIFQWFELRAIQPVERRSAASTPR
jgi:hypothetical protein